MNLYDPSVTELDDVYAYYENRSTLDTPPLGVQVGWRWRDKRYPDLAEVGDSTEYERLEWARFLPIAVSLEEQATIQELFDMGWEGMSGLINSPEPLTPKQQLLHDAELTERSYEAERTRGLSDAELNKLM